MQRPASLDVCVQRKRGESTEGENGDMMAAAAVVVVRVGGGCRRRRCWVGETVLKPHDESTSRQTHTTAKHGVDSVGP